MTKPEKTGKLLSKIDKFEDLYLNLWYNSTVYETNEKYRKIPNFPMNYKNLISYNTFHKNLGQ